MTIPSTSAAWLSGYIPDLPTPFDAKGAVDLAAFRRICERQIAAGVSALVVCETAGEASTLSASEQETIIRAAVEVARGRMRIIAGAGSNSTHTAIELTRRAEAAGADAVLSVVPYYNKPMQEGIYAAFPRDRRRDRATHHPARYPFAHGPRIGELHAGSARRVRTVHRTSRWNG